MPFNIDPDLPVPLGVQLRGVIEYGIVCGQLPAGLRLPDAVTMTASIPRDSVQRRAIGVWWIELTALSGNGPLPD